MAAITYQRALRLQISLRFACYFGGFKTVIRSTSTNKGKTIKGLISSQDGQSYAAKEAIDHHLRVAYDPRNDHQQWRRKENIKEGRWEPKKRLLWHQIEYLRSLREQNTEEWTHAKLSKHFGISRTAVQKILRSRYVPPSEVAERQDERAKAQQVMRREKANQRRQPKETVEEDS